ncbi:MAG: hypothetical protein ACYS0C_06900 [Planctomycetota bacterium]|jgi:hypothetical protein
MNKQKSKKSLDELICRAISRENLMFDFNRWKQGHQREIQEFKLKIKNHVVSVPAQIDMWRKIIKSPLTKLAAAAVLVIAVLVGIHQFGGSIDGTSAVFADVLEQIYKARTVTYKETFFPGTEREFTVEDMRMEPGYLHSEMSHGDITIWDFSSGKDLRLMPGPKKAILTQRIGRSRGKRLFNYLDWISKLHEEDGDFIGQEEIDGQIADVFLVQKEFGKTTIWVDPETNLPVRVEMVDFPHPDKNIIVPHMSLSIGDFGRGAKAYTNEGGDTVRVSGRSITISNTDGIKEEMTRVMHDFVWNADLDESLFSLELPEGYTLEEEQFDVTDRGENGLIGALAFWTEMSDGMFPSAINDLGDSDKVRPMLVDKFDKDGDPEEEFEQAYHAMHEVLKGLMFAQQCKVEGTWRYAGDGVRLGDADVPICWWKPEDSDSYRVIYGDLSIGDAVAEDLPE